VITVLLEVSGLHVAYGHLEALRGVDLSVGEGELVTVVGSNGAGKTTLLMALSGLRDVRGGSITFDGRDVAHMPPHARTRTGLVQVPEGRHLFPGLTVRQNLELALHHPHDRAVREEQLTRVLTLFPQLKDRLGQRAGLLSGGQQQMVVIGRGLMSRPRLLMLDEPSLGLAPLVVQEMFDAVVEINRSGVSILLVEQNASQALQLADRAYILELGVVAERGSGQALLDSGRVREIYLGQLGSA
jgi:branched-chain amino acid transport system ATP-binding protein